MDYRHFFICKFVGIASKTLQEIDGWISKLEFFHYNPELIDKLDDKQKDFAIFALPWLPWLKSEWKIYRYPALVAVIGYLLKYSPVPLWNYDTEIR